MPTSTPQTSSDGPSSPTSTSTLSSSPTDGHHPPRQSLTRLNLHTRIPTATILTTILLLVLSPLLLTPTLATTTAPSTTEPTVRCGTPLPISYIQYTPPSPQQQSHQHQARQLNEQDLQLQLQQQIIAQMSQPPAAAAPPVIPTANNQQQFQQQQFQQQQQGQLPPQETIVVPVSQHVPVVSEVPVAPVSEQYTVCVFCGASPGIPAIVIAANTLGSLIASENWTLLYGGGTVGIMGTVASAAIKAGGRVHGIVPGSLINKEQEGAIPDEAEYGKTTVVKDMHTRKILMGKLSNAFVALPGGFGTLDELFEVTTWNQLGIHDSPIVVVNINGFYDGILQWLDKAVEFKLVSPDIREIIVVVNTPEEVIPAIKEYRAANGRWSLDWNSA